MKLTAGNFFTLLFVLFHVLFVTVRKTIALPVAAHRILNLDR